MLPPLARSKKSTAGADSLPYDIDSGTQRAGKIHFHAENEFRHLLLTEKRRTERSQRPCLLILVDLSRWHADQQYGIYLNSIQAALSSMLREIDVLGWYERDRVIGVICSEITAIDESSLDCLFHRLKRRLTTQLDYEAAKSLTFSFYIYPEEKSKILLNSNLCSKLYPELTTRGLKYGIAIGTKRILDIIGSTAGLIIFAPLFAAIAVAIKASSPGPIFFRQQRLGLNGRPFTLLKFRSMQSNSDHRHHKDYIRTYITNQKNSAIEPGLFKLIRDNRVTTVGAILRKTSLDELPQLFNVLAGAMSLVGPRPPLAYEYELYSSWHVRRLLGCKPGLTGLWQVSGRSRTTFDDMVRLDLRYIHQWSLWLDFKILLKTPSAVLSGNGAY